MLSGRSENDKQSNGWSSTTMLVLHNFYNENEQIILWEGNSPQNSQSYKSHKGMSSPFHMCSSPFFGFCDESIITISASRLFLRRCRFWIFHSVPMLAGTPMVKWLLRAAACPHWTSKIISLWNGLAAWDGILIPISLGLAYPRWLEGEIQYLLFCPHCGTHLSGHRVKLETAAVSESKVSKIAAWLGEYLRTGFPPINH